MYKGVFAGRAIKTKTLKKVLAKVKTPTWKNISKKHGD
jgi:hypothetical protein